MIKNRKLIAYTNSVKEHASNFVDSSGKVRCPCKKFVNMLWVHLLQNGFHEIYTK